MAWSDLTITRSDLDAYEGQTLDRYSASTTLGISDNDADILTAAKNQLADDIIARSDDADFTETELLDNLEAADDRDLLKRALSYKFLAMFFLDGTTTRDGISFSKAGLYTSEYKKAVGIAIKSTRSKLSTPKNTKHFRMVRV